MAAQEELPADRVIDEILNDAKKMVFEKASLIVQLKAALARVAELEQMVSHAPSTVGAMGGDGVVGDGLAAVDRVTRPKV